MDKKEVEKFSVPGAIIIGAVIIALAVIFTLGGSSNNNSTGGQPQVVQQEQQTGSLDSVNPITDEDHVRGNKDASIVVVEYSDYECPFCKRFHGTMQTVLEEYGDDVAWVYRHWPIEGLHPVKARKEAMAAECAADQQGSEGFWQFSDRFFELTPSNNRTDLDTVLSQIAGEMNLDVDEFNTCIESEKFAEKIDKDTRNALATGGQGTPWSVIVTKDKTLPLNGAQPYEAVSQIIEILLEESN
jgi:protein-disulfide isomerase